MKRDILLVRAVFSALLIGAGFILKPIHAEWFGHAALSSGLAAALLAVAIIFFETRVRRATLKTLIGAAIGSVLGMTGAALMGFLITSQDAIHGELRSFITLSLMLFLSYVGLIVGAVKGEHIDLSVLGGILSSEHSSKTRSLILDTSVIIDGRIADIAETGFLTGTLVIPQFVLRELQHVADCADSTKRSRGRRGLDILQKMQKKSPIGIEISELDFPNVREVDLKLIELARSIGGQIVTNDLNLNKVAQLRDVSVLNINDLANALKPVVLPGETMRVLILKEGKEYNQGVAYLEDGTMVVCDNARKMIGKTIEMSVLTVLQTTGGRMIFGRYDPEPPRMPAKRPHHHSSRPQHVAHQPQSV